MGGGGWGGCPFVVQVLVAVDEGASVETTSSPLVRISLVLVEGQGEGGGGVCSNVGLLQCTGCTK